MDFSLKGPRHRFVALLGATLVAVSAVGVAGADDISNNLDGSIDAVAEVMALNANGANGTTELYVAPQNDDGKNGCNLTGSTTLTVAVASSNTAVATVSPSSVTFDSCGATRTITVTPKMAGSASISISQTSNNTGATFNLAPATFTVNVAGPANSAPSVVVAGVTGGASYDKGSVPAATCQVTDAEDGNTSFAATLSAITGSYASDGIGSQTASCSYTDGGGLTASSSETYSIGDPTAPTVDYTLMPPAPDGDNGWYTGNVTLGWMVGDLQSPFSLDKAGCVDQNITADQAATTYSCMASSAGGTTGPVNVTIKRDATKPNIARNAAADACSLAGNNGWCRGTQTAGFTASDALSGLANGEASPWAFTKSTSTNGSTVNVSSGTVNDKAGNTSDAINAGPYMIDSVKPTIAGAASPGPNANGWNNTDVNVTFNCSDTDGSGVASCGPDDTLTAEGRNHSVSGNVTDVAGNSDSTSVGGIDIDKTGPTAPNATTTPASPVAGSGDWFKDTVTVAYSGSTDPVLADSSAGSGVARHSASQTFNTSGTHAYSGKATDNAENDSAATMGSVKVDATNPTVSITAGCPNGGQVILGSAQAISVTATDGHSGLVSDPSGTVALDTATIGSKTNTISVADKVGHTNQVTCSYSVIYNWTGFFQPIDNGGVFNQAQAGRTIPAKFSLGGDQGMNILSATKSPSSIQVPCPAGSPVDALEETSTATVSGLKYDPLANQYIYNWKTLTTYVNTCRQLTITLADDTKHSALFKFVK